MKRKSRLLLIPALFVLVAAYQNCGLTRPSVEDKSFASVGYKHTGAEATCVQCHTKDRPALSPTILHGNFADCVACHTTSNNIGLAAGQKEAIWAGNNRPHIHATGLSSCVNCHAPNRPAPVNGFKHYNDQDCLTCHGNGVGNDTNGFTLAQIQAAFRTAYSYTHPSGLTSCNGCHEKNRPPPSHNGKIDCVGCHTTNDTWTNALTPAQIQAIWESSR